MITQNRKYVLLGLFFLLPIIVLFRTSNLATTEYIRSSSSSSGSKDKVSETSSSKHSSNATSFEHSGVLDENLEGAPKLAQVSMMYGGNFDILYERGLRTHVKYGERWGYPTHFLRQDIVGRGDGSEGMYNKLLYLLTIMVNEQTKPFGKRAEWLAWFDADSVLINDQIPWSVFLPPTDQELFRDINLLVSKDWIGFNAGVFLIRVCEWSIRAITDAIALPHLRPEIDLPFAEQTALGWVFNQEANRRHRIYQPRHWWNQYDEYYADMGEKVMKGCIVVHFPGMGGARPDKMGWWLDQIDYHPEKVSVPLANTSYPAEIDAYWSRVRSAAEMLRRTEDYKNQLKEENYEIYVAEGGKVPEALGKAEKELHEIIQEEAYDKQRLREAVLRLDKAVRQAKKDVVEIQEKKAKEEEEKRKKAEEEARKAEEERKKKEEERRKAEAEKKRKEEERQKKIEQEKKRKEEQAAAAAAAAAGAEGGEDEGDGPAGGAGVGAAPDGKPGFAGEGKKKKPAADAAAGGKSEGADAEAKKAAPGGAKKEGAAAGGDAAGAKAAAGEKAGEKAAAGDKAGEAKSGAAAAR